MSERSKITEIYEDRLLTRNEKNEAGEYVRMQQILRYPRQVRNLPAGSRLMNLIFDWLVMCILYYLTSYLSPDLQSFLAHLWYAPIPLLFYCVFESTTGRTPGKFITRSVVINEYGETPDLITTLFRTALRYIPFEMFSFFYNDRGWHDRWSATFVVSIKEKNHLKELLSDETNLVP